MAKRLFSRIIFISNKVTTSNTLGNVHIKKLHTNEVPVKEIQIPVQWGHLSAKLWGSGEERPILALHGWQDNAGTWDPLAPELIKNNNRPILALDFPGHGFSSWIPAGFHYYTWEYLKLIKHLKEYFKWDKVSLLAHSMGSITSFHYASLFPDDIDFYIAVDSIIYEDYDLNLLVDKYPSILKKIYEIQFGLDKEPPSYTLEEIAKVWHLGTGKSVSMESVQYLLKRGAKQSKLNPEKYYFSRDPRLKYSLFNPENKKFAKALALKFQCPSLFLKGIDSPYSTDEFTVKTREIVEQNNDKFESHFVPGTHHVHLNNPQVVLPHILDFLHRHKVKKIQGNQWSSYLRPEEVHRVASSATLAGLRGVSLWALDLDDWRGQCGCEPLPLLTALRQGLLDPTIPPTPCL